MRKRSQFVLTTKERPVLPFTGAKAGAPSVCTRIAGLFDTKIGGGSALSPGTSVMRFCSARLAVTRDSGTVIGPVGSSLPVSTASAVSSSRPRLEKFRLGDGDVGDDDLVGILVVGRLRPSGR